MNQSNLYHKNRSHGPSVNSQTWACLQTQTTRISGRLSYLEDPGRLPKIYSVIFLPAFPKGIHIERGIYSSVCLSLCLSIHPYSIYSSVFNQDNCAVGKGNKQIFRGLLDTASELTLILGDLKCQVHQSEELRGVRCPWSLAQVCLTVGPVGPWTHHEIISPVLGCVTGADIYIYLAAGRTHTLSLWPMEWGMLWWERPSGSHQNCLCLGTW